MKKIYRILFILTLYIGTLATAFADCIKDGKAYPTGTEIDGFICTADGSWRIK